MAETVDENPAGRSNGRGSGASDDRVVIKKYANRRLYNTARSSYVTLEDLAAMVRSGEDFVVYDAKTGEDITRSVLTQIIVEEEGRAQNLLPTGFLRELIRLYGDPLQAMVPGYLDAAMEAFSRNQEQLRRAFGGTGGIGDFEALARTNMELFERSLRMFSPFGQGMGGQGMGGQGMGGQGMGGQGNGPARRAERPAERPADRSAGRDAELADDLEGLRKQLREMQAQLERLSRTKE